MNVQARIDAHRAAILADEAMFDADGKPTSSDLCNQTLEAEIAAYKALVAAPCLDETDIRAKIEYMLNGSVGDRETLMDCLLDPRYGEDGYQTFMRSLAVREKDAA